MVTLGRLGAEREGNSRHRHLTCAVSDSCYLGTLVENIVRYFSFFKSMSPFKAIKKGAFFFFFNLRREQMLTDEISLADSFVSDA